jgi:prolyl-tRNA editing enzyme YbaK/EbsC (Cys-tRNA(Pro) deacylase)
MADEIISSRMKYESYAGMNGDASASSLLSNQKVRRGSVAKAVMGKNVDGINAHAAAVNVQTRPVSAKQLPAAFGQRSRQNSGEKVPANTHHPVKK